MKLPLCSFRISLPLVYFSYQEMLWKNLRGLSKAKIDSQKGFSITKGSKGTEVKQYDEWA